MNLSLALTLTLTLSVTQSPTLSPTLSLTSFWFPCLVTLFAVPGGVLHEE